LLDPSSRTLDPATIDPNGPPAAVGGPLYGQLVVTDPGSGRVVPRMAESLSTDDGLVWTLVLREGLRFTDGTPYDAAAVKFGWSRYSDPGVASEAGGAAAATIAEMTEVDARTLRIRLVEPNRQFDRLVVTTSLNHIGSPSALQRGPEAFAQALEVDADVSLALQRRSTTSVRGGR
jgi:peptide/nickel transport system substrate-binding protein